MLALSMMIAGLDIYSAMLAWLGFSVASTAVIGFLMRPMNNAIAAAKKVYDNPLARWIYTGRNDEAGQVLLALKKLESSTGGIVGRIAAYAPYD
ncbi:hypothetical protein [Thiohalophilus sp.]|uniref:hypothetical protein n=1 Tax=Thiohalophilus sp. TaxID=3028392 RepID=UPI002ACE4CF0|nr:hypothetical protein [Thiohalophilus sp.]MDZ7803500.1 hypothetical protein [Thiohalophilus sp.]